MGAVLVSPYISLAAFGVQTLVTYMSNTGAFGKTNKEVSENYFSLSTPAGYAFAIWGVIFTWEGVFVVNQLLNCTLTKNIGLWWISANVLQTIWSFAFAQEALVTSAFILSGLAGSMYMCAGAATSQSIVYVRGPLSLHAGWVAVAALLNWNLALVGNEASLNTQIAAAYSTVGAAVLGAMSMLLWKRDVVFATSIAWALVAIYVKQRNQKAISLSHFHKATIARLGLYGAGVIGVGIVTLLCDGVY